MQKYSSRLQSFHEVSRAKTASKELGTDDVFQDGKSVGE